MPDRPLLRPGLSLDGWGRCGHHHQHFFRRGFALCNRNFQTGQSGAALSDTISASNVCKICLKGFMKELGTHLQALTTTPLSLAPDLCFCGDRRHVHAAGGLGPCRNPSCACGEYLAKERP